MRAPATTSAPRGEEPLEAVLRPIHNTWVEETHRFLDPAAEPGADFWTRWAAVRYLSDDFRDRYRLERAQLAELRPFHRPDVAERLGVWCAEIELAADGLTRDALPTEATDLLTHLEAVASIQR